MQNTGRFTWSLFTGVTFGEGAEGHVGLAYTEELFNLQDAACRAVARELSIIFC